MNKTQSTDKLIELIAEDASIKEIELALSDADPNQPGTLGRTALMMAANKDNVAAIELLLARGASVNTTGHFGLTALHEAASEGKCRAALSLLKQNAETNAVSVDGLTPMMCAAAWVILR